MIHKFSNVLIRRVIDTMYSRVPTSSIMKFEKNLPEFDKFLESLPKEFHDCRISTEEYNKLILADVHLANQQLNIESNKKIEYLYSVSGFKFYKLYNSALNFLNDGDFYLAMHMIRAIVEVTATFNYFLCEVEPIVEEINKKTTDYFEYHSANQKLEDVITPAITGTRLKRMKKENVDSVDASGAFKVVNSLKNNEKYKQLSMMYPILCEYVHPNIFSNTIFSVVTKIYPDTPTKSKFFEKELFGTIYGEADDYYLDLPEKDYFMVFNYFGMQIGALSLCMDLFKETYGKCKKLRVEQLNEVIMSSKIQTLSKEKKDQLAKLFNDERIKQK
jgi:hypothetical protein